MNKKTRHRIFAAALFCLAAAVQADSVFVASASQFRIFSAAAPVNAVTLALAGAGTALPHGGFQGLVNPALSSAGGGVGIVAAGYARERDGGLFDEAAVPVGFVKADSGGTMGLYYSYLRGSRGSVHDGVASWSGRIFEQSGEQGPVEFGLSLRYEQSSWRHDYRKDGDDGSGDWGQVRLNSKNLLCDIGFYQLQGFPGVDFSIVVKNVFGYSWNDVDGADKRSDWVYGGHRTVTIGALYSTPAWRSLQARVPLDFEMSGVFKKSAPNAYTLRTGLDVRVAGQYSARFGYAYAPDTDPADAVMGFDYRNLFFGGVGVLVNRVQLDVFAGSEEFGVTLGYFY